RLGRSLTHLTSVVLDRLERKGVTFVSLTEAIDTRTSQGRLLFGLLGSVAAFERDLIAERVKAGLAASKRKNGRPKALTEDNVRLIRRMREEGEPVPSIAKQFGCSRQTVYN
ncbi:recombinase family protein, partial [Arthrospira platensis SPKY1]|nr:recombinase family protein [Arthrospira platensis SPKY1]